MNSVLRVSFISMRICCKNILFPSGNIYIQQRNYKFLTSLRSVKNLPTFRHRNLSSNNDPKQKIESSDAKTTTGNKLSQRARFKQAVRDYGATLIVFHVAISLTSLGICYTLVSSGVDVISLFQKLNFPESVLTSKVAVGSSTFVIAYALHKCIVPLRMFITLTAVPFIVRYLRQKNWIKPPKIKP